MSDLFTDSVVDVDDTSPDGLEDLNEDDDPMFTDDGYTAMTPSFDEYDMLDALEHPDTNDSQSALSPEEAYKAMLYQAPLSKEEQTILNKTPFLTKDDLSFVDDASQNDWLMRQMQKKHGAMDEVLEDQMYGESQIRGEDIARVNRIAAKADKLRKEPVSTTMGGNQALVSVLGLETTKKLTPAARTLVAQGLARQIPPEVARGLSKDDQMGLFDFVKKAASGVMNVAKKVGGATVSALNPLNVVKNLNPLTAAKTAWSTTKSAVSNLVSTFVPNRDAQKAAMVRNLNAKLVKERSNLLAINDLKKGVKRPPAVYQAAARQWSKAQIAKSGLPVSTTSGATPKTSVAASILGGSSDTFMGVWYNPLSWFDTKVKYVLTDTNGQRTEMTPDQFNAYTATQLALQQAKAGQPGQPALDAQGQPIIGPDGQPMVIGPMGQPISMTQAQQMGMGPGQPGAIDPATGLPMQPGGIDPTTGLPIQPGAIDPATGMPIQAIDPATGMPMAPAGYPGAAAYPGMPGMPADPYGGYPPPADPYGGYPPPDPYAGAYPAADPYAADPYAGMYGEELSGAQLDDMIEIVGDDVIGFRGGRGGGGGRGGYRGGSRAGNRVRARKARQRRRFLQQQQQQQQPFDQGPLPPPPPPPYYPPSDDQDWESGNMANIGKLYREIGDPLDGINGLSGAELDRLTEIVGDDVGHRHDRDRDRGRGGRGRGGRDRRGGYNQQPAAPAPGSDRSDWYKYQPGATPAPTYQQPGIPGAPAPTYPSYAPPAPYALPYGYPQQGYQPYYPPGMPQPTEDVYVYGDEIGDDVLTEIVADPKFARISGLAGGEFVGNQFIPSSSGLFVDGEFDNAGFSLSDLNPISVAKKAVNAVASTAKSALSPSNLNPLTAAKTAWGGVSKGVNASPVLKNTGLGIRKFGAMEARGFQNIGKRAGSAATSFGDREVRGAKNIKRWWDEDLSGDDITADPKFARSAGLAGGEFVGDSFVPSSSGQAKLDQMTEIVADPSFSGLDDDLIEIVADPSFGKISGDFVDGDDAMGSFLYKLNPAYWFKSEREKKLIEAEKAAQDRAEDINDENKKKSKVLAQAERAAKAKALADAAAQSATDIENQLKSLEATISTSGAFVGAFVGTDDEKAVAKAKKMAVQTNISAQAISDKLASGKGLAPAEVNELKKSVGRCQRLKKFTKAFADKNGVPVPKVKKAAPAPDPSTEPAEDLSGDEFLAD